jgi:8-oxo-dGTP pyrophosphatase MutT (NUDIX family)
MTAREREPATPADRREPEMVIPHDRLPPGFARTLEVPREPAPALPAATVVLVRGSAEGPQILLLRRNRTTGFVPGAYVFPGGRVDAADADPELRQRATGVAPESTPEDVAFIMAAAREVLEETGVLLAGGAPGAYPAAADLAHWREQLMLDRATLLDVLRALDVRLDLADMVYCAHWITPLPEPRRYDTRFFLAALPSGLDARPDPREMTDAVWLTPAAALRRFAQGTLPMVFPTVKTLRALLRHRAVDTMLGAYRGRRIRPVMPRLVQTDGGVGLVIDENDPELEES